MHGSYECYLVPYPHGEIERKSGWKSGPSNINTAAPVGTRDPAKFMRRGDRSEGLGNVGGRPNVAYYYHYYYYYYYYYYY